VLALQGDVEENVSATMRAFEEMQTEGQVKPIRYAEEIEQIDGLIIPGGESTVMSTLVSLQSSGSISNIRNRIFSGMPVMGTCAGMIMLSKRSYDKVVGEKRQNLLESLDILIERNAFGRQNDSFEAEIDIADIGKVPFRAVFIRAPIVKDLGPDVQIMAKFNDKVVAVRQNNILGTAFHPELSSDTRLHQMLIQMVIDYINNNNNNNDNDNKSKN
jgi:5'-phosphate synthase pdxT subunit